jgi:hypothetical protein
MLWHSMLELRCSTTCGRLTGWATLQVSSHTQHDLHPVYGRKGFTSLCQSAYRHWTVSNNQTCYRCCAAGCCLVCACPPPPSLSILYPAAQGSHMITMLSTCMCVGGAAVWLLTPSRTQASLRRFTHWSAACSTVSSKSQSCSCSCCAFAIYVCSRQHGKASPQQG